MVNPVNAGTTVNARRLTLLCYGAMMSIAIGLNLLPVFLTSLSEMYGGAGGLSGEQLGRLGAIIFAGLMLGIVIAAPLVDRLGAKPILIIGNALTLLSLALMAWAPSYATLAAALFLTGFAGGMLDMVLSPILIALNPQRPAWAMNWLHSFYCIGAVVAILVGMLSIQIGFGWRVACLVLMALPLGLWWGLAPLQFPSLQPSGTVRLPLRNLVRSWWFNFALVAIFLGGATELGMAYWLPTYTEQSLAYPQWMGSAGLIAFSLAMAAGRITFGILSVRVNAFLLLALSCASSAVLFGVVAWAPTREAALVASIAVGFTASALWPTVLAVTSSRYPNGGATMFCALSALGNAGGIFMPWGVGWIADRSSLGTGLALSGLAPLLLLPLVLVMSRAKPQTYSV